MVEGAETTLYAALSPELDGLSGLYLEDCAIKKPSKNAQNRQSQDHLWELTIDLLSPWMTVETKNLLKSLS